MNFVDILKGHKKLPIMRILLPRQITLTARRRKNIFPGREQMRTP